MPNQSPRAEARSLYAMARRNGDTEGIRELISVPPKIEAVLRAYGKSDGREKRRMEGALEFRKLVLKEFEQLVSSIA